MENEEAESDEKARRPSSREVVCLHLVPLVSKYAICRYKKILLYLSKGTHLTVLNHVYKWNGG